MAVKKGLTATEHLHAIREIVLRESSPFRPSLLAAIQDLEHGLYRHQQCVDSDVIPPRVNPRGSTTKNSEPAP